MSEAKLKVALKELTRADALLERARITLAEFGEDVPNLSDATIKTFCARIENVSLSVGFLQSFVRVSVLRQIVHAKPEKQDDEAEFDFDGQENPSD